MNRNKKARADDGAPLDPEKLYCVGSEAATNAHMDALCAAYAQAGTPGVVRYLQPYEAFLA